MKTTLKEEQMTTRTVQELPPTASLDEVDSPSAARALRPEGISRLQLDRQGVLSLEIKAWEWMRQNPAQPTAAVAESFSLQGAETVRGGTLFDRVEQAITREVVLIRQAGAEALTVVVRPDPKMELVLNLTNKSGRVEVAIQCEAHALEALQREYGQLQESLAQLNVRLLPLKEGPSSQFSSQNSGDPESQPQQETSDRSAGQHDSSRRDAKRAATTPEGLPEELADRRPKRASTQGGGARQASVRGFESWA
jgi:hypothetical protein